MRSARARLAAALAIVCSLAGLAHADSGDYRLVSGTLVWPAVLMNERLAVVRTDDGSMYFAELASSDRPRVQAGDRIAVVGRDGVEAGQLISAYISPAPDVPLNPSAPGSDVHPSASPAMTAAAPRPIWPAVFALDDSAQAIFGIVEQITRNTLTVSTGVQRIAVDVSRLDAELRSGLETGQEVRVLAAPGDGGRRLVAHGLIIRERSAAALRRP